MKDIVFKNIVCPTDFSEFSYYALDYAMLMASKFIGSKVHIVHCVPYTPLSNFPYVEEAGVDIEGVVMHAAKEQLDRIVKKFSTKGVSLSSSLLRGENPSTSIAKYVLDSKIDLVVIATHGYGGLKHTLFGSTTERVVRHATCPVLSVNPHTKG